jgi:TPR repeat protein
MDAELRKLAAGLATALLLVASSVLAQPDFEAGADAYKRRDYKTALALFRPLAENGESKAQTVLGLMYSYGEGVKVDFRKAAIWYRRAAEQSYGVAQYSLAMLYLHGKGVPLDTDEVVKWLTLAAKGGHARAKSRLRQMDSVAYSGLAATVEDLLATRSPPGAAQANRDSMPSDAATHSEDRSEIFAASRMPTPAAGSTEPVAFSRAPRAEAFVRAWADAWSRQAVDDYLAHYSEDFQPADGSSRAAWEALRRQRLTRPSFIEVKVTDMEFESLDANRAKATFRQAYRADRYRDVVVKTLELVRDGDRWRIVGEQSR